MNSEEIKKLIGSSLLTISAIVGTLYGLGYIEHRTQLYIFGLKYQLDDITIITNGADFILASITDSIRYFSLNPLDSLGSLFYSELILSTILLILTIIFIILFKKYKHNKFFKIILWLFVSVFCLNILLFQTGFFKLSDLLQPHQSSLNTIRLNDYSAWEKEEVIENQYNMYVLNSENKDLFRKFITPTKKLDLVRVSYYSSTLFLLLVIGIFLFFKVDSKRVLIPVVICLFFMPTTYSFIGKSLNYPYVKLHFKGGLSNSFKTGVLIEKTNQETILYTIQNDFKVLYVQNEQIDFIEALCKSHILNFSSSVDETLVGNKEVLKKSDSTSLKDKKKLKTTNSILKNKKEDKNKIVNMKLNPIKGFMITGHYLDEEATILRLKLKNIKIAENYIFTVKDHISSKDVQIVEKSINGNTVLLKLNGKLKNVSVAINSENSEEIPEQFNSIRPENVFNNLKSLEEYLPSALDN